MAKGVIYKAGKIDFRKAVTIMSESLKKTGRKQIIPKKFEPTVRTWEGEKPSFQSEVRRGNFVVLHQIRLEGGGKSVDKWFWLSFGTDVRYATMTADFRSKTVPGRLRSRKGKGGLLYVSKAKPRPGIEARNWHKIIAKESEEIYGEQLVEDLRKNLKKIVGRSKRVPV